MIKYLFSGFFVLCFQLLVAQNTTDEQKSFSSEEQKIARLAARVSTVRFNDAQVDSLADILNHTFDSVLRLPGAFSYSFDSVFPIGKVVSPNKQLRIFTWNIVRQDGTLKHYGHLQYYNQNKQKVFTVQLTDSSDQIKNPQFAKLLPENWFGALYYDIAQTEWEDGTLYTLIGWDGNNLYSNKKLIEPLFFNKYDNPVFGAPVFKVGNKTYYRLVFEFSRMATMTVKYDKKSGRIIMDHLAPAQPMYQGNYMHYGPDFSYDALHFDEGFWHFTPDVKIQNSKQGNWFFNRN